MDDRTPKPLSANDLPNEWPQWKQFFLIYLSANGFSDKGEILKVSKFLWLVGEHGVRIYNTLFPNDKTIEGILSEKEDEEEETTATAQTLAVVLKAFDNFCLPRRNLAMESFKFHRISQKEKQPFSEFETELRTQLQYCSFECIGCKASFHERMLRDRIILGVFDKNLQMKLLDGKYDKLEDIIEICKVFEAANENKRLLELIPTNYTNAPKVNVNCAESNNEPRNGNTVDTTVNVAKKNLSCFNCGQPYNESHRRVCPALRINCRNCGKIGHFQKYCRLQKRSSLESTSKANVAESKINVVKPIDWSTGNLNCNAVANRNVVLYKFDSSSVKIKSSGTVNSISSWFKYYRINDQSIKFKLDTGADISCIPISFIDKIGCKNNLIGTSLTVSDYSLNKINVFGSIELTCVDVDSREGHTAKFYVVEDCCEPLLGLGECVSFGLIERVLSIQTLPVTSDDFVIQFRDVFDGIGKLPGKCSILLNDGSVPELHYRKRFPFEVLNQLKAELDRLEELKIISVVDYPTDWVSNLQTVEKTNGTLRICLDPKPLNKCIKREHYLIPTSEDITSRLSGKRLFTVLDLRNGFWQMELDSVSADLTTFMTPFGRYRWERVPFGLCCAPEMFQKKMVQIFGDIPGVEIYFDDLFVSGVDERDHDATLLTVLERARRNNVRFNDSKIQYRVASVKFMGNIISFGSVRPDEKHLRAIIDMPKPTDKSSVKRLLGLFKYIGRFVPNLSQRSLKLRNLTRDDATWEWGGDHEAEWMDLKSSIVTHPTLAIYDPNVPVVVQTDSSKDGVGSVLLQNGQPVAYASRGLSVSERKWAQIEKELLAIVFACERFHYFLYGRSFIVQSDHKPLESLFERGIDDVSARLQRMFLRLLKYPGLSIVYVPGRDMLVADCLSRAAVVVEPCMEYKELSGMVHAVIERVCMSQENYDFYVEIMRNDERYCRIINYVETDWPSYHKLDQFSQRFHKIKDELHFEDGVLFKNSRIVIPTELQSKILNMIHGSHFGIEKTLAYARERFFWPDMSVQVKNVVRDCRICEQFMRNNQKEPLHQDEIPKYPWETVAIDLFEYAGKDFVSMIDAYSGFLVCRQLLNKTSRHIIEVFHHVFAYYGYPTRIRSDNSPFGSREFDDFANDVNLRFDFSSPRYAQSNGLAEKGVAIAKNVVKRCYEDGGIGNLEYRVLEYNAMPVASMKMSPAQLFFCRQIKTRTPISSELLKWQKVGESQIEDKIENKRRRQRYYYDRHSKTLPRFNVGDHVMFKKSGRKWHYGVISSIVNDRSYIIDDEKGNVFRRNRRQIVRANSYGSNCHDEGTNVYGRHMNQQSQNFQSHYNRNVTGQNEIIESSDSASTYDSVGLDNSLEPPALATTPPALTLTPPLTSNSQITRSGRVVKKPDRYGEWI